MDDLERAAAERVPSRRISNRSVLSPKAADRSGAIDALASYQAPDAHRPADVWKTLTKMRG